MPEEPERIEVVVYWGQERAEVRATRETLERIERTLRAIGRRVELVLEVVMASMDEVRARVEAQRTVTTSVVTLLGDLRRQMEVAMASADPNALQALADQIDANTKALADAVVAHTPADPADPRSAEPPPAQQPEPPPPLES